MTETDRALRALTECPHCGGPRRDTGGKVLEYDHRSDCDRPGAALCREIMATIPQARFPPPADRPAPQAERAFAVVGSATGRVVAVRLHDWAATHERQRIGAGNPEGYRVVPCTVLPDAAPLPPAVVARALAAAPGHERSCEDCLGTGEQDVGDTTEPCADCGGSGRVRVIVVRATPRPAPRARRGGGGVTAVVAVSMLPLAAVQDVDLREANRLLVAWGHRLGAVQRPSYRPDLAHVLLHEGQPVAVTITSSLIRSHVGAGWAHLTRENTVELSRLCAARPGLCRAMLRLWRELVFPALGYASAVSYQDAAMHRGDLYRFDGWRRLGETRSGTDARAASYRCTRRIIWGWNTPEPRP